MTGRSVAAPARPFAADIAGNALPCCRVDDVRTLDGRLT
jgi:hypothetical protein